MTGALIAGGWECFPPKLTPLVRALMTSIQNECDRSCQIVTASHMATLLDILSGTVPVQKIDGFKRTYGKILKNLSKSVISQVSPGCVTASQVIGLLVDKLS